MKHNFLLETDYYLLYHLHEFKNHVIDIKSNFSFESDEHVSKEYFYGIEYPLNVFGKEQKTLL